MHNFSIF